MRVKCIHRQGDPIPDFLLGAGYFPSTEIFSKFGEEHTVYGMTLWNSVPKYLIVDTDSSMPYLEAAYFFEVIDDRCPHTWSFAYYPENRGIGLEAIWGYPELVDLKTGHYDGVLLGDPEARKLFHIRRMEIENSIPGEWAQP